jgi:hypothetical protein
MPNARHVIILAGRIVSTWQGTLKKDVVVFDTTTFTDLTSAEKRAVDVDVQRYSEFLGLPMEYPGTR